MLVGHQCPEHEEDVTVAFYQCFKTTARDVYCSGSQFNSHADGAAWVTRCMQNFGIVSSQLLGKPYESDNQPTGATIWG